MYTADYIISVCKLTLQKLSAKDLIKLNFFKNAEGIVLVCSKFL